MLSCCAVSLVGGLIAFVALVLFVVRCYIRRGGSTCPQFNSLQGKTIIVTGASSGVGLAACEQLASRGARVIMGVRNPASFSLTSALKSAGDRIRVLPLDLTALDTAVAFAKEIVNTEERLDIILHNAGFLGPREWTVDGMDNTMSVQCYGPALLTLLLLDKLRGNPAVTRIVFSSCASLTSGILDYNDLDGRRLNPKAYYKWYCTSKLTQYLLAQEMARKYRRDGITVYAASPGLVNSNFYSHLQGVASSFFRLIVKLCFRSVEHGAQTAVYCASATGIEPRSGGYFVDCQYSPLRLGKNYGEDCQEKLWEKTTRTLLSKGFPLHLKDYKEMS